MAMATGKPKEQFLEKVPLVAYWNLNSSCVCPDNGILYVGNRSINYIGRADAEGVPEIRFFQTRQHIQSVDVDPAWCDKSSRERHFAVLAGDNTVQIWDFDQGCAVRGHKVHSVIPSYKVGGKPTPHEQVLISYMCNRSVLSLDQHVLVVYCVASNTYVQRSTISLRRGQQLTVLRCAPHNEALFALGTSHGHVLVYHLQRMGVLHTLGGHEAPITSLAWNIVEKTALQAHRKKETPKKMEAPKKVEASASDDIFNIYDYDYLENEFGAPTDNAGGRKDSENSFIGIEKPLVSDTTAKFDFVEACQSLKEEIDALKHDPPIGSPPCEVTLDDCKMVPRTDEMSSSCGDDSSEEDPQLDERSFSDDDVDVDGIERQSKQQILHQAEVHAAQTLEKANTKGRTNDEAASKSCSAKKKPIEGAAKFCSPPVAAVENATYVALLASASSDGHYRVWNVDTGRVCDSLKSHGGGKAKEKESNIAVAWLDAFTLMGTNKDLSFSTWSMEPQDSKQRNDTYKYKKQLDSFKQSNVVAFGICQDRQAVWCISRFRQIYCMDLRTFQLRAEYSCASSRIETMAVCPADMNKIAIGFFDSRIGIIDISKMSPTNIYIKNYNCQSKCNVYALAWSPDSKQIAFGTCQGAVSIINVDSDGRTFHFNPFMGKAIYSIEWQGSHIYVANGNSVVVYEDSMTNKDFELISGIKDVATISVRHGHLFVGTESGSLQIYAPKTPNSLQYEIVQEIELTSHYIKDMKWSPMATELLAVVGNDNSIHVLHFDATRAMVLRKILINNPKMRNASVQWSNRNKDRFMTCGRDGTVRVWDLAANSGTAEEVFVKQFSFPLSGGLFLPTDEEILMCSGTATTIEFVDMRKAAEKAENCDSKVGGMENHTGNALDKVKWAIKAYSVEELESNHKARRREQRLNGPKTATTSATVNTPFSATTTPSTTAATEECSEEVVAKLNTLKLNEAGQEVPASQKNGGETALSETKAKQQSERGNGNIFMKLPVTILYLTTMEVNKEVLDRLSVVLEAGTGKRLGNKMLLARLFGPRSQAKELLAEEFRQQKNSATPGIAHIMLPLIGGQLKEEILACIQRKQLSEWHVAVAPTISYSFWLNCCRAFAEQLAEQGCALQAATYMLALHKPLDAIHALLERNYYKEALLVARIYLQHNDPMIASIVEKWIEYLIHCGNLSGASLLCALAGQLERSYKVLSKVRNSSPAVERVLDLMRKGLNKEPPLPEGTFAANTVLSGQ